MLELNKIYNMDCYEGLKQLGNESVNCCITSPPYWGLRDYGVSGQIGVESSVDDYIEKLVLVFREVKRVLRADGTLWLNLGDTYCSTAPGTKTTPIHINGLNKDAAEARARFRPKNPIGLKPKDLIGIPWKVAFALQADGWYLRSDIIWSKSNCMPESVTDRPTRSHEYLFLLSKSRKYFYDYSAIKEPTLTKDKNIRDRETTKLNNTPGRTKMSGLVHNNYEYKNKRSVWTVGTSNFKEAHFATFPPKLIEPCILAGCAINGIVLDPFMGSGTTAMVSFQNQRNFIGFELNPEYIKIAEEYRLAGMQSRIV